MQPFQQDLIKELRLRRWARQNYVPPEKRSATWHPVVLEEMKSRDAEMADRMPPPHAAIRYVPLPPRFADQVNLMGENQRPLRGAAAPRTDAPAAPPAPHAMLTAEYAFYGS